MHARLLRAWPMFALRCCSLPHFGHIDRLVNTTMISIAFPQQEARPLTPSTIALQVDEMLRLAGAPMEGQIKYADFAKKLSA